VTGEDRGSEEREAREEREIRMSNEEIRVYNPYISFGPGRPMHP